MSLTPELVALCYREVSDANFGRQLTRLTADDQDAIARRFVDQCGDQPLWIFAYGSLIWKPDFDAVECRRATALGWHRSFCIKMTGWRATPEQPGLMLALDHGGRCDGVAMRIADDSRLEQTTRLVGRELVFHEFAHMARWVTLRSADGPVRALVFWAGPKGDSIVRRLPLDEVAAMQARACGHAGSCAEYLYNTVSQLQELGIRDRNLWRLQKMVADEIVEIYGLPAAMSRR